MIEPIIIGDCTLYHGDCLDALKKIDDNSIDSVVSDPPYFLTSIVKRFGSDTAAPAKFGKDGSFARLSGGFMNAKWDSPEMPAIDPGFAHWMAGFIDGEGCFSVHKKNVNGCETYDCQFSITLRRDDKPILIAMKSALGGIGSLADRPAPKGRENSKEQSRYCISSKADCQRLRAVLTAFPLRAKKARDFEIWCHALDAWISHEPGSSWEDISYYREQLMAVRNFGSVHRPERLFFYRVGRELLRVMKPGAHLAMFNGTRTYHHMVCGLEDAGFEVRDSLCWLYGVGFPKSHSMRDIGHPELGTALKPANEPIVLARKPLSEGTVAANVLRWRTGALNIDACRVTFEDGDTTASGVRAGQGKGRGSYEGPALHATVGGVVAPPHALGRWPANVVHDGSDEVVGAFPDSKGQLAPISTKTGVKTSNVYGKMNREGEASANKRYTDQGSTNFAPLPGQRRGDSGSAARFFYSAKASKADRAGSKHPTVKPIKLLQWLTRLITPPGGMVLDPFAGSGTTGAAAEREGFRAVLIEREAEYVEDIKRRLTSPQVAAAVAAQQPANDNRPRDLFGEAA